ncbi:MAG: hypothetical protein QXG35_10190 [Nitrososphaerota archaeon]
MEARASLRLIQMELDVLKELLRGVNATITNLVVDNKGVTAT